MKLTAENFFRLLKDNHVTCFIRNNHLSLSHDDTELVRKLHALLNRQPDFEATVIQHLNVQYGLSLKDFMTDCEGAGVTLELSGLYSLNFKGGKDTAQKRLAGILERNSRLKAAVILSLAAKNSAFLDVIQECACNRWSDGYSDSLLMAVLSNLTSTNERIRRDENGQIILQPKTDWDNELSNL